MQIHQTPELRLSLEANEKIECWTEMADGEVSGLGTVHEVRAEGGTIVGFEVDDVFLVDQVSTTTSTELDDEAVAELLVDAHYEGYGDRLRLWWHSHGEMATFWSSTDDACIEAIGGQPYLLSLVVNQAGERRGRLDLFEPFRITVDELPIGVILPRLGLYDQCQEEFDAKVIERPIVQPTFAGRHRRRRQSMYLTPEAEQFAHMGIDPAEYDFSEPEEADTTETFWERIANHYA